MERYLMVSILRLSVILDLGASLHMFNDLSRFSRFRKAPRGYYLLIGTSEVPILGYGDVFIQTIRENGSKGSLRLQDVAYYPDFLTNVVSFRLLRSRGIYWNIVSNTLFRQNDSSVVYVIKDTNGQQIIEEGTLTDSAHTIVLAADLKRRQPTSRKPQPISKGDGALWHARMGHLGPGALHMLGIKCLGVDLCGPPTSRYIYYAQAKIPRQISRRPPDRKLEWPCQKIHID